MARKQTPAVAYLRTSSAANVGADKDSDKRQRDAIMAFAKRQAFTIEGEFYDAAV
ncbi:MAG: serine recombinase, partial [Alphaproteobacteria bacterium]|nr:serine recombinase [Alphaproteobacteria bacterium]